MKVAVDTNVLVRVAVRDDEGQAREAAKVLEEAAMIVVSLPCLCEFVWVLRKVYHFSSHDISTAIRALIVSVRPTRLDAVPPERETWSLQRRVSRWTGQQSRHSVSVRRNRGRPQARQARPGAPVLAEQVRAKA